MFSLPRGLGFRPTFFAWGSGFKYEKFSLVLKENCGNFSICFKEIKGSLKSRCSCAGSYQFLENSRVYCILNNMFSAVFVIFANLDHHKNFEHLTSQGLSLTFGLFQGYSLGYS